MTKRQSERVTRLILPNGEPRWIRCYDNGGESLDQYTVVYTGHYTHKTGGQHWFVNMNAAPFHPQGIGMHGEHHRPVDTNDSGFAPAIGRKCHLGKRIPFAELPKDCRKLVMQDYLYLWDLPGARKD